jgi:hypothetical protein
VRGGGIKYARGSLGQRARGTGAAWHGRRVEPESGSVGGARRVMTGGARPSAAAGGGRTAGPAMGRKPSWAELRRVEQRPTEKKSRGTPGLREMDHATKQE